MVLLKQQKGCEDAFGSVKITFLQTLPCIFDTFISTTHDFAHNIWEGQLKNIYIENWKESKILYEKFLSFGKSVRVPSSIYYHSCNIAYLGNWKT